MTLLSQQHCLALDHGVVRSGIEVSKRYGISYWDGAIIAAAAALEAPILYTEHLNHGQAYGGVTVVNPFFEPAPPASLHERQPEPFQETE